jgi:hypothetical protein
MADVDAARRQESYAYSGHESRPTLPQSPPDEPIVVHGVEWRRKTILETIGGVVARRTWSVRSITDDLILKAATPYVVTTVVRHMNTLWRYSRRTRLCA